VVHRPSPYKVVRNYLLNTAFFDSQKKETIALVDMPNIIHILNLHFQDDNGEPTLTNAVLCHVADHLRGEVLEDQLGRGSLQK
jgi:hypothetical protein